MEQSNTNIVLWAQVFFSLAGFGFSMTMLLRGNDASIYLPVLTGILSAWMPSPIQQFQKKKSNELPTYNPNDSNNNIPRITHNIPTLINSHPIDNIQSNSLTNSSV